MPTTQTQDFTVELIENEIFDVELVENEIFGIDLTQIDIIHNTRQFTQSLEEYLILNEAPTQLTTRIFQTANDYISGSLIVYYNGMKLLSSDFTIIDNQTFKFGIDTLESDGIEVSYIKNQ